MNKSVFCIGLLLATSDKSGVSASQMRRLIDAESLDDGQELVQYKLKLQNINNQLEYESLLETEQQMGDVSDNQKKLFKLLQKQNGGGLQIVDMNHSNDPNWYESLSDMTLNIQHAADVHLHNEKSFVQFDKDSDDIYEDDKAYRDSNTDELVQQKFEKDSDDIYEDEKAYKEANSDELVQQKAHLRMRDDAATDVDDAFDESQDYHSEPNTAEDLLQTKSHVRERDDADNFSDETQDYHTEPESPEELIQHRQQIHLISRDPADDAYDEAAEYHAEQVMNDDLIQQRDPADDIADDTKEYHAEPNNVDDFVQTKALHEVDDVYEEDKQYHAERNSETDIEE